MSADWRNRRCDTCDFWQSVGPPDDSPEDGECRFHAPRVHGLFVSADAEPPDVPIPRWPLMSADDWCGCWRPLPVVQGAPCARVEGELAEARAELVRLRRALLEAEEESDG